MLLWLNFCLLLLLTEGSYSERSHPIGSNRSHDCEINGLPATERSCILNYILHRSSHHDRSVRPLTDPTLPIRIYANLYLIQIMDIDESKQCLRANVQLRLQWCNPFLSWNRSALDEHVNYMVVKRRDIWTPDVIVHNSVNIDGASMEAPSDGYLMRVFSDGLVKWHFQEMWMTTCQVFTNRFPFDRQTCTIYVRSGSMPESVLKMIASKPIVVSTFIKTEWTVLNSWTQETIITDPISKLNFTALKFTFHIKSVYHHLLLVGELVALYVTKILVPFSVICVATMFTFLLPPEANEKIALSVTILLSLIIYLQILTEHLPRTNQRPGVLTLFCNLNFCLVVATSVSSVVILHLYYTFYGRNWKTNASGGLMSKCFSFKTKPSYTMSNRRRRRQRKHDETKLKNITSASIENNEDDRDESVINLRKPPSSLFNLLSIKRTIRSLLKKTQKNDQEEKESIRLWKKRVLLVDKILFILFFAMLISVFLYFLIFVKLDNSLASDDTHNHGLVTKSISVSCDQKTY